MTGEAAGPRPTRDRYAAPPRTRELLREVNHSASGKQFCRSFRRRCCICRPNSEPEVTSKAQWEPNADLGRSPGRGRQVQPPALHFAMTLKERAAEPSISSPAGGYRKVTPRATDVRGWDG